MIEIIKTYQSLLDNECLPIQQQELDRMDNILRETGFCIIAGYHGSGKSSLARRYSHYKHDLRRVYCKGIDSQNILYELEKDSQPVFLDSVTPLLYDNKFFQRVKNRAEQSLVVLGVHIEPENISLLFSDHSENLITVGSLCYEDARLIANYPFNNERLNLDKLLDYSGMRRRDLINLCMEAYLIGGNFSPESIEQGTKNLADKSQRVYKHIFEEHFTEQQREVIKRIITDKMIPSNNIDANILVRTGILKKNEAELVLNGRLLELIFKKFLN